MHLLRDGDLAHYGQPMEYCMIEKCWRQVLDSSRYSDRLQQVIKYNRFVIWYQYLLDNYHIYIQIQLMARCSQPSWAEYLLMLVKPWSYHCYVRKEAAIFKIWFFFWTAIIEGWPLFCNHCITWLFMYDTLHVCILCM